MMWNGDWDHMDGAWEWLGAAMMIGWMVLIVLAVVALLVWLMRSGDTNRGASPRDVIDARFARGEIDEEQRRTMLKNLS